MYDVTNKVAVITGSARGLGKAFAIKLLENGAKVCISDIQEDLGNETCSELQQQFGKENCMFKRCDVSLQEDWCDLWQATEDKFGAIHILINNAGFYHKDWRKSIDVMLKGHLEGIELALKKWENQDGKRIINIASMAGLGILPDFPNGIGYTAAKWGMVGVTRMFEAVNLKMLPKGIKCYSLCPCYVDTALFGDEKSHLESIVTSAGLRVLKPDEVGQAMLQAFKCDQNGANWVVFPDLPVWNTANLHFPTLIMMIFVSKIMTAMNMRPNYMMTYPTLVAALIFTFFVMYIMLKLFRCIFF